MEVDRSGNERSSLSVPSSQLHAPPQISEHADCIDRIDGTCTARILRCTAADVLKVERPGNPQLHLIVVVVFAVFLLRFARLECRRVSLRPGSIPILLRLCLCRSFGFVDRL